MIIPCIDLQDGRAVQLVHGRKRRLAVDDVFGLLERFREYPLLHVIDLDAAMGKGSNARLVGALCRRAPMRVRVGGGIRTAARAARHSRCRRGKNYCWQRGVSRWRVNSAFLSRLAARVGRKRVIVAVDTDGGRILVRGWQEKLRLRPEEVFSELAKVRVGVSLHLRGRRRHHARHESGMVSQRCARATHLPITAAGGIRSHREVRALERIGMNSAVGMAMYLNRLR